MCEVNEQGVHTERIKKFSDRFIRSSVVPVPLCTFIIPHPYPHPFLIQPFFLHSWFRASLQLFQNKHQQDDPYGLSFISRLVVLYSTCFELQGAHHQDFTLHCTGSLWHTV